MERKLCVLYTVEKGVGKMRLNGNGYIGNSKIKIRTNILFAVKILLIDHFYYLALPFKRLERYYV